MLRLSILISLAVLIVSQPSVNVVTSSDSTDATYFDSVKLFYAIEKRGDYIVSIVSQTLPSQTAPNFKAVSYSINSQGELVSSPSLELVRNETAIGLEVAFKVDQLTEEYGCTSMQSDEKYISTVCKLEMHYLSLDEGRHYVIIKYSMGIKISTTISGDFVLGVNPIMIDGCNCELVTDVPAKTAIYTDSGCSVPLKDNEIILYGSTICLKMYSEDAFALEMNFETTMLNMYYKTQLGNLLELDVMSIAQLGCGNPCEAATAYAILNMPVVGQVFFQQVVVMNKRSRRVLTNDYLEPPSSATTETPKGIKLQYQEVTVERSGGIRTKVNYLIGLVIIFLLIL